MTTFQGRLSGLILAGSFASVLSVSAPPAALAQSQSGTQAPGSPTSMADALVEAYLSSPELAAQRANVKAAGEVAAQVRAGRRPTVTGSLTLSADAQSTPAVQGRTDEAILPTALNLQVIQNLYTGGQIANSTSAAERRIDGAETTLSDVEQTVLLNAITAFLDVREDEQLVRVSQNNVKVLREQLAAAEERFEVGEVTRTDVEQARARMAASRSNLAAQEGALQNARDNYRRSVGSDPGKLAPPPPLPDLPETEQEAVLIALRNDPNIVAARIEREASGFDVKAAIGALLPQVSLTGQLVQTDTLFDETGGTRNASVGVSVTIPFYSGGANYAAIRQAQAQVENAEANITTELRDARQAVGIAWAQLRVARAQIQAGQLEVRAAQLAFEGVREEAKVGARTTLDVLDAEQETLNARADLISAQRNEMVAAYQLLEAMGLLTVRHLGLDVGAVAEPGAHYASIRERAFGYDESDDTVWSLDWRP